MTPGLEPQGFKKLDIVLRERVASGRWLNPTHCSDLQLKLLSHPRDKGIHFQTVSPLHVLTP